MRDDEAVAIYQDRTVGDANAVLAGGGSVLLLAPTGAGKTRMTIRVMEAEIAGRGGRGLLMHEQRGLAQQSAAVARSHGLDAVAWFGEKGVDVASRALVYTTVDAVANDAARFGPVTLYGVDEVHHAAESDGGQYDRALTAIAEANPRARTFSTTATENRADERPLHPVVTEARRIAVTWKETIEAGMIVPARSTVRPRRLADGTDFQDHARRAIDPLRPADSERGLNGLLRRSRRDDDMEAIAADFHVDTMRQQRAEAQAAGRPWEGRRPEKTLVFADLTRDADALAAALSARGIAATSIHSKMGAEAQERAKADYAAGRIEALVSVDLLAEGFDSPDTRRILCAKATTSSLEYVQMVNRATRAEGDKKHGLVHDYGASTRMHGASEIYAAVEAYLEPKSRTGRQPREENRFVTDWKPWSPASPDAKGVFGIDLGGRHLFAKRIAENAVAVVEVRRDAKGAKVSGLGVHEPSGVTRIARSAIRESFRTVVSLCSDVGNDSRSAMTRSVEEAWKRHGASATIAFEAARPPRTAARTSPARTAGAGRG